MEITIEQANKNIIVILESDKLELNKKSHVLAQLSLETLFNTAKEVEILRARVADLELLSKKKK